MMIEQALTISLPESYKRAVVPFRIPALAGNTDYPLWDDAQRLVEFNRQLRAGSLLRPAWPPHLFAVGNPHGDELIALATRSPDGPVWWLDHGVVDSQSSYQSSQHYCGGRTGQRFSSAWIRQIVPGRGGGPADPPWRFNPGSSVFERMIYKTRVS